MKLLQRLEELATHQRRRSGFRKLIVESSERKTGEIRPAGFATSEEYELFVRLGVVFWANSAQYIDARQQAERHLAHEFYRDQLLLLNRVRSAVFDGDAEEALRWIGELQDSMTSS